MIAVSRQTIDRPWAVEEEDGLLWLKWFKGTRVVRVCVKDLNHALVWAEAINREWSPEHAAWVMRQAQRGRVYQGAA